MPFTIDDPAAVGALVTMAIALWGHLPRAQYPGYAVWAHALLQGTAFLSWPVGYHDFSPYGAAHYLLEGPLPAYLMVPFVLLGKTWANQAVLGTLLGGLTAAAAWKLAKTFELPAGTCAWLCGLLLLGTDVFWCATRGDMAYIAHLCALFFSLSALAEIRADRRGWMAALYAAGAMFSHLTLIFALPVYAFLLRRATEEQRRERLVSFALVTFATSSLWLYYVISVGWSSLVPPGSLMLINSRMMWDLAWTTPALALLFLAPASPMRTPLWAGFVVTGVISAVCVPWNTVSFDLWCVLDAQPFVFALIASAARARMPAWGPALCAYSMFVGVWGCWHWIAFDRPGW